MRFAERHSQIIAAAVAATGALFLAASIFSFPFLSVQPPGAYFLMALSIAFMFSGVHFFIKARRGQLAPGRKSITDVRLQAIEKMDSPDMLRQIARDDPDTAVRSKALKKLETLAAPS
jgi:hypothetical protein